MIWALQCRDRPTRLTPDPGRYLINDERCLPKLFRTRATARAWAESVYGYTRNRPDLLEMGFQVPQPVKVTVEVVD